MLKIEISADSLAAGWQLWVAGRLIASGVGNDTNDRDTLWDEVVRARCLDRLPMLFKQFIHEIEKSATWEDHVNATPELKRTRYIAGFADGLGRKSVGHPWPGLTNLLPGIAPAQDPSYRRGYDLGIAIAWFLQETEEQCK